MGMENEDKDAFFSWDEIDWYGQSRRKKLKDFCYIILGIVFWVFVVIILRYYTELQ
jgi:hypothetical protein